VLVNGGVNLSELDGWWAEAFTPEVGWAFGDGLEHGDDPSWDASEADALYGLLERQVVPEFYSRDQQGIPKAWVARMRESMARLTPRFSASRAVSQYVEQYYLPAATDYRRRSADSSAIGLDMIDRRRALDQKWSRLRFGEAKSAIDGTRHNYEVEVYLDDLGPGMVQVELYANGVEGSGSEFHVMQSLRAMVGASGGYVYGATLETARSLTDYTARLVPIVDGRVIPLEDARILWQH
jgi:starch phosphorylase